MIVSPHPRPGTIRRWRTEKPDLRSFLVAEAPAIAGMVSALIAYAFEDVLFADLNNYPLTILLFIWLFGTMMWCAFGAVRHADAVAVRLGEPYGTLVLTLSVIVIEVSLLAAIIILFYLVFVVIQTMRHRAFFAEPKRNGRHARHQGLHTGPQTDRLPITC
jgi:Ca2+/H+ antiporter